MREQCDGQYTFFMNHGQPYQAVASFFFALAIVYPSRLSVHHYFGDLKIGRKNKFISISFWCSPNLVQPLLV